MAEESFSSALARGNEYSRGAYLTSGKKSSGKLEAGEERQAGQVHVITCLVNSEFVETVCPEIVSFGYSQSCNGKTSANQLYL